MASAHSVWTTLGLPQLTVAYAFQVYTAQAPGCSAGVLSKAGPAFPVLARSKLLRFRFLCSPQGHSSVRYVFVPFPGPSSSGDQVLGRRTVPVGLCVLITSQVLAAWFSRRTVRALSLLCRVSHLGSCNPPGRCQLSRIQGICG